MIRQALRRFARMGVIIGMMALSAGPLQPAYAAAERLQPASAAGQRLLVLNGSVDSVLEFNGTTGAFDKTLVSPGGGGLFRGKDMTFGPDGNLYVSGYVPDENRSVGVIKRFDGVTGAFIDDFVPRNIMRDPGQVRFGPDGNLYVSQGGCVAHSCGGGEGIIFRFNGKTGALIDSFVIDARLQNFVAFTFGADGNLYASTGCCDSGEILRFNGVTGAFIDSFAKGGPSDFWFSLAFGPHGDLYGSRAAVIGGTGRIDRYDGTTGDFVGTFVPAGTGGMKTPQNLTFGPDGNLFVADEQPNGSILRFNGTTGAFMDAFSSSNGLIPMSIVFATAKAAGERLLVVNGDESVLEFNGTTGAFNKVLLAPGSSGMGKGVHIAYGPDGKLYVLSGEFLQFNSQIGVKRFDGVTAEFIDDFVPVGNFSIFGQMRFGPKDGNLYVNQSFDFRGFQTGAIVGFNGKTGEPKGRVVELGSRIKDFTFGPDGNLYVSIGCCDAPPGILRFNGVTGAFIDAFTEGVSPESLVFGPDGDLYESVSGRIDRFDGTTGAFIGTFVPHGKGGMVGPRVLNFGPDKNLYVIDAGNAILRFDGSTGNFLDRFASVPGWDPQSFVFSQPAPVLSCEGRAATILGTDGDDVIHGTPGNDIIAGLGGNDIVSGLGGNDIICGGPGQDFLIGGPGDDRVFGEAGEDLLFGGESSDDLFGGSGNDHLLGGTGSDRLSGEEGDDILEGGVGGDRLDGGSGKDGLQGGQGDDTLLGQAGDDVLSGGVGSDIITGGSGRDILRGGSGDDRLSGEEGDDVLSGGFGSDQLSGGAGNDSLFGDSGDDALQGGQDTDVCYGGTGKNHPDAFCERIF